MTLDDLKDVTIENDDGIFVRHNNTFIEAEKFIDMFDGADFKHSDLVNHERATPLWIEIFNEWKKQGILN